MAKKPDFRTCPQCSTRNRLDKEFCVKCGEPLEGVKAGDPNAPAPTGKGKPGFYVAGGEEGQNPAVPLVLLLMTIGVGVAGWQYLASSPPPPVEQTQARPMVQGTLPPAAPLPSAPGVQDYSAGMAALRAGDFPAAVRLLRQAVTAADRADYRAGLAEALEKSGATAQALAEYEAAAGKDPSNGRYVAEWARALNRAGRLTDAIRTYNAALALDSQNIALLREVTNLLVRAEDLTAARPLLVRLVQLQPDDLAPKQQLAKALEAANDLPGAITQYQAILTAMPGAHLSRSLLSEVYMKQNRPDDALRVLNEGLAANPGAAILHREKGRVFDRLRRDQEAIAAYQEYLRLAPTASDARAFTDRIAQLTAAAGQ